ncbi:hypothetical protein IPG36_03120 [bacterium]|nr:MAG: hypothetical protein IPG36_03120 [bacterium]
MKIKIVRVPAGSPPLWVRQASVELVLPCAHEGVSTSPVLGIAGGKPSEANITGYQVAVGDLVSALRHAREEEAARWWERRSGLRLDSIIQYGEIFCDEVA